MKELFQNCTVLTFLLVYYKTPLSLECPIKSKTDNQLLNWLPYLVFSTLSATETVNLSTDWKLFYFLKFIYWLYQYGWSCHLIPETLRWWFQRLYTRLSSFLANWCQWVRVHCWVCSIFPHGCWCTARFCSLAIFVFHLR